MNNPFSLSIDTGKRAPGETVDDMIFCKAVHIPTATAFHHDDPNDYALHVMAAVGHTLDGPGSYASTPTSSSSSSGHSISPTPPEPFSEPLLVVKPRVEQSYIRFVDSQALDKLERDSTDTVMVTLDSCFGLEKPGKQMTSIKDVSNAVVLVAKLYDGDGKLVDIITTCNSTTIMEIDENIVFGSILSFIEAYHVPYKSIQMCLVAACPQAAKVADDIQGQLAAYPKITMPDCYIQMDSKAPLDIVVDTDGIVVIAGHSKLADVKKIQHQCQDALQAAEHAASGALPHCTVVASANGVH